MTFPMGTVTFLFTDIEGSTRLWDQYPEAMRAALVRHDSIVRAAIESNGGIVFKTIGDAFCAAFHTAADGVAAAIAAQRALYEEAEQSEIKIKVRMALHAGTVDHRDNDYFGQPLNRVSRLLSTGHGGQILVSSVVQELVRDSAPSGVTFKSMGEHTLRDLSQPQSIFQLIHPDLTVEFPALKSLQNSQLPNNLPHQVTSFVGREKEMADVKRMLASTRLLTLIAIGGSGKTRLSMQVAADVLDDFRDGVWLVELAAITEPALVAQTVAQILNVHEESNRPVLQSLTENLKPKQVLIILDNCEHLLQPCAELAGALIRSCPNVKILASSREALNVAGETTYFVPPLSLPDPARVQTASALSEYEAVGLFIDRAKAARLEFAVTNKNAPALAQLCFRLDGIPLAIELAAARIRNLTVEEINARLDNRFRLLTGGSRNALPRQQTLRALIDWSYDLLKPREQAFFSQLSQFAGGWTLDAAEKVCAGEGIEDWEVFDLLNALVDKSLVLFEDQGGVSRYRQLETIREYARERLAESATAHDTARRHALYYADLAARESKLLRDAGHNAFEALSQEAGNLRAALEWLSKDEQFEAAAEMAVNLTDFWTRNGRLREGYSYLEASVRCLDMLTSAETCALVLKAAGWLAYLLNDKANAESLTERSIQYSITANARSIQANALNNLALITQAMRHLERAVTLYEQSVKLYRELQDDIRLADALMNLVPLQGSLGDYDAANKHFEEARKIYERQSDVRGLAGLLCNQSDLALKRTNWMAALDFASQSLSRFRQIGDRIGIASALANRAEAAARLGQHETVDADVREAIELCEDTNYRQLIPYLLVSLCRSQLARNSISSAANSIAASVRLRSLLEMPSNADEESEYSQLRSEMANLGGAPYLEEAGSMLARITANDLIARLLFEASPTVNAPDRQE